MFTSKNLLPIAEAKSPFFAGIDVGGTNIKIGLVDNDGRPVAYESMPTNVSQGIEAGVERMAAEVHRLGESIGMPSSAITAVGLATPGVQDVPAGILIEPHNLPGWNDFPIRDALAKACGLPVTYANDANAAAYGEHWVGGGQGLKSIVLLTLGTGIGGGIIIDDRAITGEHSLGAECGHIIIDSRDDARYCPCGKQGHLEGYASATALIQITQEALDAGEETTLRTRTESGESLSPLMMAQEAEKGDALSNQLIMDTARYLAVGITTLYHTIDPEGVVLGGAMTFGGYDSPLGRKFLEQITSEVRSRVMTILADKVTIEYAKLGGDAGFIGAAGMARVDCQ